jgi:hypothetical protein
MLGQLLSGIKAEQNSLDLLVLIDRSAYNAIGGNIDLLGKTGNVGIRTGHWYVFPEIMIALAQQYTRKPDYLSLRQRKQPACTASAKVAAVCLSLLLLPGRRCLYASVITACAHIANIYEIVTF